MGKLFAKRPFAGSPVVYGIDGAAAFCRVPEAAIRRALAGGRLPTRKVGGAFVFLRGELERFRDGGNLFEAADAGKDGVK